MIGFSNTLRKGNCTRFFTPNLFAVQDDEIVLKNARPIIGILAQELPNSLQESYNETSYIGAAYVKYIEAAGARVVPILINQDDEYYELMFNSTNGLLIPGGAVSLTDSGNKPKNVFLGSFRSPDSVLLMPKGCTR